MSQGGACFNAWGRKRRKRQLKENNTMVARRISHLWHDAPQIPSFIPFSQITCYVCRKHFVPDSILVFCPLYVHVRCYACNLQDFDGKCPCFAEIEAILNHFLHQPDMARKITFMTLNY